MGYTALNPLVGAVGSGVRFVLARAEGDEAGPFVVLHHGRRARTFLAEVRVDGRSGANAVLRRFALKVQDDRRPPQTQCSRRPLTNPEIDAMWQREVETLAEIDSPHVARAVPVPSALLESRPVTWCAKIDRYFHPVCGETGELLAVCKSDALLAASGLVQYSRDTWRYLHAEGVPAAKTFYRLPGTNGERPGAGVVVRCGAELFRDWSGLVHAGATNKAAQAAAVALPCLSCEHRFACYPHPWYPHPGRNERIPAEDHLHAVSFYDLHAQALELLDLDYDQLCDLLGGGDFAMVLASGAGGRGQQRLSRSFTKQFAADGPLGQWLFATDSQRFPREVLRAKLTAFLGVCAGVQALHLVSGRPHFGLSPVDLMARLAPAGGGPARWGCQVQLVGLGGQRHVVADGLDTNAPALFEPEPGLREDQRRRPYGPPDPPELDGQGCAMIVKCQPAAAREGRQRVVLEAPGGVPVTRFRAGDFVHLTARGERAAGEVGVWARIEEMRCDGVVATAAVNDASAWGRWAGTTVEATCMFFRSLGPPVDLYSLGMLLFRAVLGNDEQNISPLHEAVAECVCQLRAEFGAGVTDGRVVARQVDQFLGRGAMRNTFAAWNVLQRRGDRVEYQRVSSTEAPPIDPGLWRAVLEVGFKLVSQVKGYSYSDGHAEGSPFLLTRVQTDLEALRQQLHVDLFAADLRTAMIAGVCEEVRDQLRMEVFGTVSAGNSALASARADHGAGFHLTIRKDGELSPREYDFARDQVTLGRRESDNVVHLGDPMVSGQHAILELQPEGYVILDRNSTNGTEVDGIRLPGEVAMPLQDGSSVRIGPFTIIFRTGLAGGLRATATSLDAEFLYRELCTEFAARFGTAPVGQRDALRQVLRRARHEIDARGLLARVEKVLGRVCPGALGEGQPAG